ncbi:beta-N-acetylglucosaminidase domain-containing protein [Deinococcus oregonensis]|uniref:Beta-N-acetylglucosaminidase domain-containing protein n=1 Tax=Deinococcus oregonensis TaxID=1805970 RepID=A0ABV6AUK8_9DEIO
MMEVLPGIYRHTSSAHVYAVCDQSSGVPGSAVLVNIGDGSVLDDLPPHIRQVQAVLLTHHHRDVAAGAARAVQAGIPVYAPEGEGPALLNPQDALASADLRNNYEGRPWVWTVPEGAATRPLRAYQTFSFGGLSFTVRPTPGPTPSAVSLLLNRPAGPLAFTGSLLYSPGQVAQLAATQWTYNGGEGIAGTVLSLLDLADQHPARVLPAHGEIMEPEALTITAEALRPLLALRRHNPRLWALRDQPYAELRPWLLMNRTSLSCAYVLRAQSGRGLMIDFGYDFCFGQANSTAQNARRPWLYTLPSLLCQSGVSGIDAVIPTHYHDDHVAGIPLLREVYGAQLWAPENMVDVLKQPERYRLPCLWFEGMTTDQSLPLGQPLIWEEFQITPYALPGHARAAAALLVETAGERVLFGGDQYSGADGLDLNYTYPNLFREGDYLQSAELYARLRPQLILSGHNAPLVPPDGYFEALLERGQQLQALHASLQPHTARLLMQAEPITVLSGDPVTLILENPTDVAFEGRVELSGNAQNSANHSLPVQLLPLTTQSLSFTPRGPPGSRLHFELRGPPGEPSQFTHVTISPALSFSDPPVPLLETNMLPETLPALPERRGVLEAFYGRPWSWSERHAMLDFMHEVGFNAYLYAPKNDPIHRNRWQEPYTPTEWAAFGKLAAHAHAGGTEFIFGLSAVGFRYSNPAHLALLQAKLRAAKAQGIRSFALLLDDLPSRFENSDDAAAFPDLARAQAWLSNELLQEIEADGEFYFCPTEYHGSGNSAYLWALGSVLDPRVQVLWTGREVCSRTISAADLRGVTDALSRLPVIWDNFPVNDLEMQMDLHVAPLTGRTPDLLAATGGYFAAAGALAAASQVALRTTAAYLQDPHGYDPTAAFRASAQASTSTPAEAAALLFLADLARRTPLTSPEEVLHHALWPALDAFWAARGGPPALAGLELSGRPPPQPVTPDEAPLRLLVQETERHAETLAHLGDPVLRANVAPWAAKLAGWGRVLKYALGALDHPHDARAREYVLEELPLVRENFHWVAGDTFDLFARRCVWAAEAQAAAPVLDTR